jgi:hypothetical protein
MPGSSCFLVRNGTSLPWASWGEPNAFTASRSTSSRSSPAIPVTEEEGAQIDRFRYVLSHGCKEGLVERLRDWPGVHCVRALLDQPLEGLWFNRTREYAANKRGEEYDPLRYAEPESVTLTPLPCWRELPEPIRRRRIAGMVEEIETEAARVREQTGRPALGVRAILAQDPHAHPLRPKKSPPSGFTQPAKVPARDSSRLTGCSSRRFAWPRRN